MVLLIQPICVEKQDTVTQQDPLTKGGGRKRAGGGGSTESKTYHEPWFCMSCGRLKTESNTPHHYNSKPQVEEWTLESVSGLTQRSQKRKLAQKRERFLWDHSLRVRETGRYEKEQEKWAKACGSSMWHEYQANKLTDSTLVPPWACKPTYTVPFGTQNVPLVWVCCSHSINMKTGPHGDTGSMFWMGGV